MSTTTAVAPLTDAELINVLQRSVYPGASLDMIGLVLEWCRASKKDPLKKPVHIVPMYDKRAKQMRDVLMPSIADYRIDATRTGQYAGMDSAVFGPILETTLGEGDDQITVRHPEWCEVTVYRMNSGARCPFPSGRVYWLETYATKRNDSTAPNAMWRKRIVGQLEKCAEALALRRAFPEALGGTNTAEEMTGQVIDGDYEALPPHPTPKKGVHKPSDGCWARLSEEEQKAIHEFAAQVQSELDKFGHEEAMQLIVENEAEILNDADKWVALWTLFDSKDRSAFKKTKAYTDRSASKTAQSKESEPAA